VKRVRNSKSTRTPCTTCDHQSGRFFPKFGTQIHSQQKHNYVNGQTVPPLINNTHPCILSSIYCNSRTRKCCQTVKTYSENAKLKGRIHTNCPEEEICTFVGVILAIFSENIQYSVQLAVFIIHASSFTRAFNSERFFLSNSI